MPDPIRTGLMFPSSLLIDDAVTVVQQSVCLTSDRINKLEEPYADEDSREVANIMEKQVAGDPGPGPTAFKWDPYGRDVPKQTCEVKVEWSVEPLVKYLKKTAMQIEANIETHRLPTAEKLNAFITRLIANTQRLLKHAPKDLRSRLQLMLSRRFQRFWNFSRNEKVRSTNPEELKSVMTSLIEMLMLEFVVSPAVLTDPGLLHAPLAKHRNQQSLMDPCGRF
jgi:hypothetical protein